MKNKIHVVKCVNALIRFFKHIYELSIFVLGHLSLCFVIYSILFSNAHARDIYYGKSVETITLRYGSSTLFRFNEDVKTISQASKFKITPADPKDPNYKTLSITPRFLKGSANVSFILTNGEIVNTKLITVSPKSPENVDSFYDFLPKKSLIENNKNHGSNISDIELMKSMIRWDKVVGYKMRDLVRTLTTGNRTLSIKLVRLYTGPKFNGYIFKVRNLSRKKKFKIDLTKLSLGSPNQAILSQVDKKLLGTVKSKKNTTFLRIVARPTSQYKNMNLPFKTTSK